MVKNGVTAVIRCNGVVACNGCACVYRTWLGLPHETERDCVQQNYIADVADIVVVDAVVSILFKSRM